MTSKPLFSFFLILCCIPVYAQKNSEFIFRHLTVSEGLSSNTAFCTLQDKKGFWWFGTDNGLQRWDGYRFIEYHKEANNEHSLYSDNVVKLFEDSKDNLWIASVEGVTIFNKTKNLFTRVPLASPGKTVPFTETINSLFEDTQHNIWICGNSVGLQYYDDASSSFKLYNTKLPPYRLRFNFAAQQPSTGNFWFGTDSGLVLYDVKTHSYYDRQHSNQLHVFNVEDIHFPYTGFYLDREENLWLCNWPYHPPIFQPTYFRYAIKTDSVTYFKKSLLDEIRSFAEDADGRIWLGGTLLHYYNGQTDSFTNVPKQPDSKLGMDYDVLFSVNCDRDNNMWMGTDNGVYVFEPRPRKINTYTADTFKLKEPDPDMPVTGFLPYDKNNIWVTTWGRGVFLYDSLLRYKKRFFKATPTEKLYLAWCAAKAKNGHIWFGWQEGIFTDYDPVTGKYFYGQPPELRGKTVRQIVCDTSGNIWMGTQRGILAVCDPGTKKIDRIINGDYEGELLGNIMSMKIDNHQRLWVATSHNGLFEVDAQQRRVLRHFSISNKRLLYPDAADICFYNDTTLFIAAQKGIEILNTKTGKVSLFEYAALRTSNIRSIQKGGQDEIYFAGSNGVFKINFSKLTVRVYTLQDGLLFNGFTDAAHTLLGNGSICFGTNRNFITIAQTETEKVKHPVALISGIRIMNQPISVDSLVRFKNVVELTYDRNYVAIDFAVPSMLFQQNNSFLYKLEGFDKDWKLASQYPSAEYSNLPPGRYRFMVKYRNTDGRESSAPTIIPFIIHPPFYLRWWFIAIALCLVGSIIYLLHRIRVNKLLTMEKVRIHIARDLHDDMGSTLSSINILSVMSGKAIDKEPAKTKEYLARISAYSQRMMESMDDIVWSINPLNDSMERIVARMREVAATCLEPKDIEYKFYIDENVQHLKLDMSKRREWFLIYKEAINNMAKYAECTRAIIHITSKSNRLIMHIEDNGCGFDETLLNEGNGLINMRKRAGGLGGRLTIKSEINQGTELTLNIPVK